MGFDFNLDLNMSRLEQLQAFLKESPDDPFILFALAKEYEKQGDDDHTKQYFLQLTREHPKYVGTYYHLGKWKDLVKASYKFFVTLLFFNKL